MTKSFKFESMSLFEINFIIDMLGKLDKLGQGILKKIMLNYNQGTIDTIIIYFAKLALSDKKKLKGKYLKTLLQKPFHKQN